MLVCSDMDEVLDGVLVYIDIFNFTIDGTGCLNQGRVFDIPSFVLL